MKNVVVILVLTLLLAGCKEEENVIQYSEAGETVFYFNSWLTGTEETENTILTMRAYTTDFVEIPKLSIDQKEVLSWFPGVAIPYTNSEIFSLYSEEIKIPYKKNLPFKLERTNLSTEGNIPLPSKIKNLRCNGTQIISNNYLMPDTIQKSLILKFEWDCEDSDSFYVSIRGNIWYDFYTTKKMYENLTLTPGSYSISISSIKGNNNKKFYYFLGRYGKGYFYCTWQFKYQILIRN